MINEVPISDYIYIGGGFPEIFAKEIELNKSMRESIKKLMKKTFQYMLNVVG